jgi:hypothetical protein
MEEGDLCCEQLQLIKPIYSLYEKKAISFHQFKEKLCLLVNKREL